MQKEETYQSKKPNMEAIHVAADWNLSNMPEEVRDNIRVVRNLYGVPPAHV